MKNGTEIKKVLLISPPWFRLFGQQLSRSPLGLCYIAGVLEKNGYQVSIYNADYKEALSLMFGSQMTTRYDQYLQNLRDVNHPIWQEIKDVISEQSPDLVGISVTTAKYGSALNVSRLVKEIDPNVQVVWGGIHPTIMPDETIKNKDVDIVVRGEGEQTFLELARNITSLSDVLGITYKENGRIIHNPNRPLLENLDTLPFPARHLLLGKEAYHPEAFGNISASRGCPYQCTFCASHKLWTRKIRYRSPTNVIDEIKNIKKVFKTDQFKFDDDSFTFNTKFVEDFCAILMSERLKIKWSMDTRANLVSNGLMKKMKSAGCEEIYMGIESGDERTLKLIKKGVTLEQIWNAKRVLDENRVRFTAFFMIGFPWETKKEIDKTVSLMRDLDPYNAVFSVVTPYPGTELYDTCLSEGLLGEKPDWSTFFHQSPDMYLTRNLSRDEICKVIAEVQRIFDKHNSEKMRQFMRSNPLWVLRRIIKYKYYYHPRDLWKLFRRAFQ
jgi:radical SAM superfamily enzyme YgiQ (UPF0313 family)